MRATLLNAQTGQCIPLDDPTWVPEIASSHLLAVRDDRCDRIARGYRPWACVADAHVSSSADGGDGNAGEAAEVFQRAE